MRLRRVGATFLLAAAIGLPPGICSGGSPAGRYLAPASSILREDLTRWLFRDLIEELASLLLQHPLPHSATRADQEKLALLAKPVIEKWYEQRKGLLLQHLPRLLQQPAGKQGYQRNPIAVFPKFGIFCHVWAPDGETDIHNHDGNMGMTLALTPGFEEEAFMSTSRLRKPWDGQVVTFDLKFTDRLQPGKTCLVLRGSSSIHRIRNTADEPGIMIEIYFWKQPFTHVNNPIPIEGSGERFYVLRTLTSELTVKIAERLIPLICGEVADWQNFSKTVAKKSFPIFTTENTAIVDRNQLREYVARHHPRILTLKNGQFLLGPNGHTPLSILCPDTAAASL